MFRIDCGIPAGELEVIMKLCALEVGDQLHRYGLVNLLAQKQHKKPIRAPVKQSHFTIAFLLDGS